MAANSFSVGDIINPVTDARLNMSLSGPALAKRLGLSRQYLNRAEQGTYAKLNPALLKWVANALSVETRSVERMYEKFQKATRHASMEKWEPHKLVRSGNEPGYVLFERWRSGYFTSPTQFAVAFCVHPDAVQKYEEGIQRTMPKQIVEALEEVDLIDAKTFESWTPLPSRVRL